MSTLQRIRKKVRRLTASPDVIQLPDSEIDEYIDTFYEQDFPAELKLISLHGVYSFYTEAHQDKYALPVNTQLGINPPIYISGLEGSFYQDETEFNRIWPRIAIKSTLGSGDGSAGPYNALTPISNNPILKRQFFLNAVDSGGNSLILVDDGEGNLTYPDNAVVRGSINYLTGAIVVTDWGNTIPTTSSIVSQHVPYSPAKPFSALFYQNNFYLRPIPDTAYKIEIEVYKKPSQLLDADSDEPDLQQWWQLIAFGAAMKILEDRQDEDTLATVFRGYENQKQLVLHRTILQQANMQTKTIYNNLTSGNYLNNSNEWF